MVWTAGTQLYGGRYTIQHELGRGRFGITYLARDRNNTPVVIKTLSDRTHPDRDRLQQLIAKELVPTTMSSTGVAGNRGFAPYEQLYAKGTRYLKG